MLDHPAIDVALGVIFFYIVLSLVASAVQEWFASLFGLRAKTLKKGVERLVGSDIAKAVYGHPLIKNLAKEDKLPSYIKPETLSAVLLELLAEDNERSKEAKERKSYSVYTADEARNLVSALDPQHPLRPVLSALIDNTQDAAKALKEQLADWFDEGMTRVSGWYKRQAKVILFVIAAAVTVATNASTFRVAETLWENDSLRATIAAEAVAAAHNQKLEVLEKDDLKRLKLFPIGWDKCPDGLGGWAKTLLGWLITIAAVSLGAPFWFDLLGKVARLKGVGGNAPPRPKEQPKPATS